MSATPSSLARRLSFVAAAALAVAACVSRSSEPAAANAADGDAGLRRLEQEIVAHTFRWQPTQATLLGMHGFDQRLEDWSPAAIATELAALKGFRGRLAAIEPPTLSLPAQLDRELLLHAVDSRVLTLDVVRPFASNPDLYSSGITNSVYVVIKRDFAPAADRLKVVIARERAMPALLAQARANLVRPPRVLTEIAIELIPGNRDFFASAVPGAFADVKDAALLAEFGRSNAAVLAALDDYGRWLADELLPRATGEFALGADVYRRKLWADEMVDAPLDDLLKLAEADLRKNQAAFAATARLVDPKRSARAVLDSLQLDHPPAAELLATTQRELDSLAQFISEHHILTIPDAPPARVQETPPFLRATTSASMDTPGPFEARATEAYYSMTLPDPASSAADQAEFMKQWYFASITNVSVHEVWPGHYLQFLHAKHFTSDARKVFGVATNAEGWAHYCEQMMVDEGLHQGDPKLRLAQLQDALLRDVRFIVGIKLHTAGLSLADAKAMFINEAYQPEPVATSETKRGTTDATYGYYTMGKLMILELRQQVHAKLGATYSLQRFHDEFIRLGPLPLPLIRRAMIGGDGKLL